MTRGKGKPVEEKVGIVAVAQTDYGDMMKYNSEELAYMAIRQVLERTGLSIGPAYEDGDYVDADIICHEHIYFEKPFSASLLLDVAGGNMRPEEKIDGDGAVGVAEAVWQILSGDFETILVVAECHENLTARSNIEVQVCEPFYLRPFGLDDVVMGALQARRYMDRYGVYREDCASVVVKNRANAHANPHAFAPGTLEVADVLDSRMLAYPIAELDVRPTCDGACAMILASEKRARQLSDAPVWITGIGSCFDSYFPGDRDLSESASLKKAAGRAYRMAGISDPRAQLDVAEVSEHLSFQELMWCEGLGLCGEGEGASLLASGATALGGDIPINLSGGAISGCPHTVVGMARIAEVALQLAGEAGDRQVEGAKRGLAHAVMGPCGQFHQVTVLESD